ncbi:unnamed protein product [Brassica rapa]|uniref:Uncharacterized protein n=2 Tax=Brassica TaxID=3705 RepID=A0A8D9HCX2_BRACM|nr:unnamed protein product [Brassica napus]CAG7895564.1 unnamed protein product [Brassica rapa]
MFSGSGCSHRAGVRFSSFRSVFFCVCRVRSLLVLLSLSTVESRSCSSLFPIWSDWGSLLIFLCSSP